MADAGAVAAQVDGHKGQDTGTFRFWDVLPVRPDDWLWRIVGASANGNTLELHLVDGMGDRAFSAASHVVIQVEDPEGYAKTSSGFSIDKASRVRWGDCDVKASGGTLHITWEGSSDRPMPSAPALAVETR